MKFYRQSNGQEVTWQDIDGEGVVDVVDENGQLMFISYKSPEPDTWEKMIRELPAFPESDGSRLKGEIGTMTNFVFITK